MKRTKKRSFSLKELTEPVEEDQSDAFLAWQIQETLKGLKEADAGDFATDEEVEAVFSKYILDKKR